MGIVVLWILAGIFILSGMMLLCMGGFSSVVGIIVALPSGIFLAYLAYHESPEVQAAEEEERKEKEIKRKQELDDAAEMYGADEYIFSICLAQDFSIDTVHKLFHYERGKYDSDKKIVVLPISNLRKCGISEHLICDDRSFSNGMKDGAMAALTGVGTVRSSRSNVRMYRTGKADVSIEYIDQNNRLCSKTFLIEDYPQAERIVEQINELIY
mgnify:CR=1 FL=1